MRICRKWAASILCAASLSVANSVMGAATFQGLGFLTTSGDPNYSTRSSTAEAVSGDGKTVVGWSTVNQSVDSDNHRAFIWTAATGMQGIPVMPSSIQGDPPPSPYTGENRAVNADGSIAAGYGTSPQTGQPTSIEAYTYNKASSSYTHLGFLNQDPLKTILSYANGISSDGSTVVGVSFDNSDPSAQSAVFWHKNASPPNSAYQVVELPDFARGVKQAQALAVNVDGTVVVGSGTNTADANTFVSRAEGAVWTIDSAGVPSPQPLALRDLAGGFYESVGRGVSRDGSLAVGTGVDTTNTAQAVMWALTSPTGADPAGYDAVALGSLPVKAQTNPSSTADAVTVTGTGTKHTTIVGKALTNAHSTANQLEAFVWTDYEIKPGDSTTKGMQDLRDLLVKLNPSLSTALQGWTLTEATSISDDGSVITGIGTHLANLSDPNSGTVQEAFVVKVPEPLALPVVAVAALLVAGGRRRRAILQ
jgi:uncharacterized membrane protein